ncbi:hypothetical protein E4T56_gene12435 [Termitomyces sp. T112]|nr:hypothetical protein E4T56_gene12435 [Termitomyces sp. T112]
MLQDGTTVGSSEVTKTSKGSDNGDDNNDNVPLAQKHSASLASVASIEQLRTIASKEREKEVEDVEMRKKTPLAMIAEAELATSDMEVEGGEEFEAAAIAMEKDTEEDKGDLVQDAAVTAALLSNFDKRAVGVERRFQKELEAAREELLVARVRFSVAKRTLATLVGYQCDCQAFLAWQEENNIEEEDWEEEELGEVPHDNADLDA